MMLQKFGIICLMILAHPSLFYLSEKCENLDCLLLLSYVFSVMPTSVYVSAYLFYAYDYGLTNLSSLLNLSDITSPLELKFVLEFYAETPTY